jgi:hypothetical protein
MAIVLPASLLGGAAGAAAFLAQTKGAADAAAVAGLVAAITAAEACGAALASRLPPAGARGQLALMIAGMALLATAVAIDAMLPLMAMSLGFLLGLAEPLRAAAVQRMVGDTVRARAASAASACDMAVSSIALPLAGMWRSRRRS